MLQAEERAVSAKKKADTARSFYFLVYRCYKLLLVITMSSSPIFMRWFVSDWIGSSDTPGRIQRRTSSCKGKNVNSDNKNLLSSTTP